LLSVGLGLEPNNLPKRPPPDFATFLDGAAFFAGAAFDLWEALCVDPPKTPPNPPKDGYGIERPAICDDIPLCWLALAICGAELIPKLYWFT